MYTTNNNPFMPPLFRSLPRLCIMLSALLVCLLRLVFPLYLLPLPLPRIPLVPITLSPSSSGLIHSSTAHHPLFPDPITRIFAYSARVSCPDLDKNSGTLMDRRIPHGAWHDLRQSLCHLRVFRKDRQRGGRKTDVLNGDLGNVAKG